MSFRRLLYTLFLYAIFPFVLLRLLWRSRTNIGYRKRWSERLGFISSKINNSDIKGNIQSTLCLHAVSVGEVIAAKPLIIALLEEYPEHKLVVTTTTPTGSDRVKDIFSEQIKQQNLIHIYFPYDLLGPVSRFINACKPKILIVVETEIWPNLYAKCYQKNIPVIMVNARLSENSTQSYLKIKGLVSETLSKVNLIAVRSQIDADRFSQLGAVSTQLQSIGNIKYDLNIDQNQLANANQYREVIHPSKTSKRLVFVAASTHAGEDAKIVDVYKSLEKQYPDLLLVLVPRHPERFEQVYLDCVDLLSDSHKCIKHSEFRYLPSKQKMNINLVIGDSMGEMQMWYSIADVVFIGGSLVKTGGHNPLEATIFGVPVFSGPHMFNFEDIASELLAEKLLFIGKDEFEVTKEISRYLESIADNDHHLLESQLFKTKTDEFMKKHRGVTARLMDHITRNMTH